MIEADEIENRLAGLRPSALGVDRDALMYRAGYAAGRAASAPSRGLRMAQAAALSVVAAGVVLVLRAPQEPTRLSPVPAAGVISDDRDPLAYWLERRGAMTRPDPLPPEAVIGPSSDRLTARALLDQLLSEAIAPSPTGDQA